MIKKAAMVLQLFCVYLMTGQSMNTEISESTNATATILFATTESCTIPSHAFETYIPLTSIRSVVTTKTIHATNSVIYKWCGALTPTSIKINAKLTSSTLSARAVVSTNQNLSNPRYSKSIAVTGETNYMGSFQAKGLQPNTVYFYGIQSNGITDTSTNSIGKFKTPKIGGHSYSFTTGACNSDSSS
jgi:hypothetical protein